MERIVPIQGMLPKRKTERNVPEKKSPESTSGGAERALSVLQFVARAGREVALADISDALAIPKGTAHRLCTKLSETGFLSRDLNAKAFVVGPALRALALDTLNHDHVRGLRHTILEGLVAELGETCNFTTLDGAQVIYLDRVEARWPLRLALEVGSRVPLHCTASGKLFLSLLPAEQSTLLRAHLRFEALTPNTITNAAALNKECKWIATNGYALDREEFIAGLIAIAVPVVDQLGTLRAALAMHAPTARMTLATAQSKLPQLKAAALAMGRLL
jgi:DNA-binding IclR family transcriptional regulator